MMLPEMTTMSFIKNENPLFVNTIQPYPRRNTDLWVNLPTNFESAPKSFIKIQDCNNQHFKHRASSQQQMLAIDLTTLPKIENNSSQHSAPNSPSIRKAICETKNSSVNENCKNSEDLDINNRELESEASEKDEYLKAIFEVVRIDPETK